MKKIIHIIVIACLFVTVHTLQAQEKEQLVVPLSSPDKAGVLKVGLINGSISITGYNGKEIIIDAEMAQKKVNKSTKNGLTRVSSGTLDVSAEERNNNVRISTNSYKRSVNLDIKVPKNFSLNLSAINNGDINVDNVNGEFEVKNINGKITMTNISGSVNANTTNGKLTVSFNKIDANTDMALSSFNDNIDLTLPKSTKATIKAKSDQGEIFTDFDMTLEKRKPKVENNSRSGTYRVKIEQWVYGKINGGGSEIMMKSFNGDIIVREKK